MNTGHAIAMIGVLAIWLVAQIYKIPIPDVMAIAMFLTFIIAFATWGYHAFTDERKKMFALEIEEKELKIKL